MSGKRYKKQGKNIKDKILSIILLIFVVIMIFTGIKIIKWIGENIQSKNILDDISNTVSIDEKLNSVNKYNVDFENLKQKNSDTVAWIKVNGTDIEYPVVKTNNNDYYLTHSFDKSYNSSGWVFMDCKNRLDGTDNNMVVYAHNRRDGSMFGSLKNILNEEWQKNKDNLVVPFITEEKKEEYQVFSVYRIEKEDYYITTNFSTNVEFQAFIDKIKARSVKDFNVNVSTQYNILTLSTCADNNKYRVVLHAKKIVE